MKLGSGYIKGSSEIADEGRLKNFSNQGVKKFCIIVSYASSGQRRYGVTERGECDSRSGAWLSEGKTFA